MREVTIEEIEKMEDGEIIPSVRGTIKAVYERKETGGQYPGTAQNAFLANGDKSIGLRVENHDDISHLKGKEVLISCWKNDKGIHGIKVMSGEYDGKPYHKIKVTKVGTFTVAGKSEQSSGEEQSEKPPSQESRPSTTKAKGGELHTKKRLMQLVYLDMMCERAVQAETEKLAESGIVLTPEEKIAKVGRFFISLTQKPYSEAFDYSADLPSNKYPDLPKPDEQNKSPKEKKEEPPKQEEPKQEEPKKFPEQPAVPEEAPHPDDAFEESDIPF